MIFWLLGGEIDIPSLLALLGVLLIGFAYHELAHAVVADRLGDPTPRMAGRMTLNPFPHLSLIGLIMLLLVGFGGAYTPVRPQLMRGNIRRSAALVAIAGPIANVGMAVIFAVIFKLLPESFSAEYPWVARVVSLGVWVNMLLAFFNMIPIPPLDGFTVLQGLIPAEWARMLDALRPYGMIIFMVVIFVLPQMGVSIFEPIVRYSSQIANMMLYQ